MDLLGKEPYIVVPGMKDALMIRIAPYAGAGPLAGSAMALLFLGEIVRTGGYG